MKALGLIGFKRRLAPLSGGLQQPLALSPLQPGSEAPRAPRGSLRGDAAAGDGARSGGGHTGRGHKKSGSTAGFNGFQRLFQWLLLGFRVTFEWLGAALPRWQLAKG